MIRRLALKFYIINFAKLYSQVSPMSEVQSIMNNNFTPQ